MRVMHGVFDENAKLAAGLKTVNDIWNIIPYENLIVTATLSPDEIKSVMEEVYASHEPRSLLGIAVKSGGSRSGSQDHFNDISRWTPAGAR